MAENDTMTIAELKEMMADHDDDIPQYWERGRKRVSENTDDE